jgi:hypothetical protein
VTFSSLSLSKTKGEKHNPLTLQGKIKIQEGEKQEAEVLSTPPQAYKVFNFLPTILSTPPQAYGGEAKTTIFI